MQEGFGSSGEIREGLGQANEGAGLARGSTTLAWSG